MKKIILIVAVFFSYSYTIAQTEFDALKITQTDINGTARYMSMAGAFGALGGDASAIKDNPAGLGIYRRSEIVGTLDFSLQNSESVWNGKNSSDNMDKIGFNNFSYISAHQTWGNSNSSSTGLLYSNWSFSFNRLKNFNRNLKINGGPSTSSLSDYMAYLTSNAEVTTNKIFSGNDINYDNVDIPYLSVLGYEAYLIDEWSNGWGSDLAVNQKTTPLYQSRETGGVNEYALGWSGNFNNKFFLGARANLQSINYNLYSTYNETFNNPAGGFTLNNTLSTTGAGVNFKIGAIAMPTDFLRLGLSVSTPTYWFSLDDSFNSSIESNLHSNYYDSIVSGQSDNYGSYQYKLQSPTQLDLSAALIFKNMGLLSFEYDYSDYTTSKFMDANGSSASYNSENDGMRQMLKATHTFKVGGEYKLTDNFSLRAGYAYTTSATTPQAEKLVLFNTTRVDSEYFKHNNSKYFSAGFGYREADWFIDFAYMNKVVDETFYPYNSNYLAAAVNPASVITSNKNMVVTLGFKF